MIDLTKYQDYPHPFEIHPIDVFSIDIHPETVGNVAAFESHGEPTVEITIVSMPSIMSSLMTTNGLTPTIHDDIVSGYNNTYVYFGTTIISSVDLSTHTATITYNNTELTDINVTSTLIDDTAISNIPSLADYEGQYIVFITSNDNINHTSGTYNVTISIDDIWSAITEWEEIVEPDALNFTMPNGGTITLIRSGSPTIVTLEYTLDGGATWTEWVENGTTRTLTLQAGEKVYIRNTSDTSTGFGTSLTDYYQFAMTDTTEAHGNCNSLLCKNPDNAVITDYAFRSLFGNSPITTSPDLPSETIGISSYQAMFFSCSNLAVAGILGATSGGTNCCTSMFYQTALTETPVLHISIVPERGFRSMFFGCTSLVKVTTYMTDITAPDCLEFWLHNLTTIGDFYCPSSLNIPLNSTSGIPTGWTRHDI